MYSTCGRSVDRLQVYNIIILLCARAYIYMYMSALSLPFGFYVHIIKYNIII